MAEKTDEEIIKELSLEASNDISDEAALEELTIKDDNIDNKDNTSNESTNETNEKVEKTNENVIENEDKDDDELSSKKEDIDPDEIPVQKKQSKLQKILIGVVSFLVLIIILGTILYFTGFFDPEPVKKVEQVVQKKPEPQIVFDEDEINKKSLNQKLTRLTKTEIMNKEELEAEEQRIKEEERKKKEEEQKAIEEKKKEEEAKLAAQLAKIEAEKQALKEQQDKIKQEQENFLKLQEEATKEFEKKKNELLSSLENNSNNTMQNTGTVEETQNESTNTEDENKEENLEEEPANNQDLEVNKEINTFLSFINVATIKGELYKSFLDKVTAIDKNVSLCRDNKNRVEIYFGPYYSNNEREKVLNNLLEKGFKYSYSVDFTQEEYEKRCKY
jgi:hypothetical protein